MTVRVGERSSAFSLVSVQFSRSRTAATDLMVRVIGNKWGNAQT
jgi:hypothetical protein